MFVLKDGVIGSTFSLEKMDFHGQDCATSQKRVFQVTSLDSLLASGALPPISFVKADVEGYERELLLGAEETIRRFRPRLSICTYHLPDDWKVIPGIIRGFGMGYRVKFGGLFDHVYGWWKDGEKT